MPIYLFFGILISALLMILTSMLMSAKKAFEQNPALGIVVFLFPPVLIIYSVLNFSKLKKEIFLYAFGCLLMGLLFLI